MMPEVGFMRDVPQRGRRRWASFRRQGTNPEAVDVPVKHANDPVRIVVPIETKARGACRCPAAFWNQHMTGRLEVLALCGRPSDFYEQNRAKQATTKAILMQSMREVGFHDADAWVDSANDFPRVRGDRFLMLLEVTRGAEAGGKVETYSLDELLEYRGWGISAGPYGWMFKGDPERATTQAAGTQPVDPLLQLMAAAGDDRFKICGTIHRWRWCTRGSSTCRSRLRIIRWRMTTGCIR